MNTNLVRLTDVCDFQGGSQPPKNEWSDIPKEGYVRMLQIRDFTQGKASHVAYVMDNKKLKKCDKDDILIGRYGASIGKILTGHAGAYNVAIMKAIPNPQKLNKQYLYFLLKSPIFQNFIQNVSVRAAQAGFSKQDLLKYKFSLPADLDDQIRIANLLNYVESLVAKRVLSIKLLDNLLNNTFLDMFGDPVINPKKWDKDKLVNLTSKIGSGSTPKGGVEVYSNKGFYFIRSQNVRMNKLKFETMYYIDENIHNKMKNTWVKHGDVLLNITGASIGRVAYFEGKDNSANVNQHVSILRPNIKNINYIYLTYCISQENFQKYIMKKNIGGTREAFNFTQIKNFQIPTPPLSLQKQFATVVEQVELIKIATQESLKELKNLFGSLSQKAFKGELDLLGLELSLPEQETIIPEVNDIEQSTSNEVSNVGFKIDLTKVSEITDEEILTILNEKSLSVNGIVDRWHELNSQGKHYKEVHFEMIKDRLIQMLENKQIEQSFEFTEVLLRPKQ